MFQPSQIRHATDAGALAWLDQLLVAVWRSSTYEGADIFYDEMKKGFQRFKTGVGHLAVIEPKSPMPSPESRQRITQVFDEHPTACAAVAVVFEGTGFFASAVGSVASGIMLLSGRKTPFRVCNSVPEAALFLARHMSVHGEPITPGLCKSAVEELRTALSLPRRTSRPPRMP